MKCAFTWKDRIPIVKWLPRYSFYAFQCDFIAGITVALMVIPQGLAYAVIAGLPTQYGLYSAFMGGFVYCLLGSTKDLAVGPAAIMALMAGTFGRKNDPNFAITLSLCSGVVLLFMGVLSLGFIVRLIPVPVVSGFTSAASVIIACEQLPNLLGLTANSDEFFPLLKEMFSNISQTKTWDVVLGVICMGILELMRNFGKIQWPSENEFPPTLPQKIARKFMWVMEIGRNAVIVFSCMLVAYAFHCRDKHPFSLTGEVPEGLPPLKVPKLKSGDHNSTISTSTMLTDIGAGLAIVPMIAFLTSIAIAQSFARKNNYQVDPSQELIALGVANVANSFVSGFPIAGCFSRTTVNSLSGVATPFGVHIKDLRMVRVQQRPFDKKYEYIFEVTWSNGKVFRIHRAYGELFDFQCKLRRRFSKEISKMTERKVIPYLPARRPIKLCKGSQILPDITQYVSDFTKLPEKLLHSESVENFFSDGTDKHLDEKQTTSKTKQNSHHEKKDHTNATCKRTDASRVNVDVKSDKGAGSIKNHSPKGKYLSSFCGRKLQLSGRIDSRKRPSLSPKTNTSDIATTSKVESKGKTNHYQPKTILKSPNASSTQSSTLNKTINEEIKIDSSLRTQNSLPGEKLEPERTIISKDIHLKTNINDSNNKNTITGEPNPRTDIGIEENTGSCPSTSVVKQETSSTQTSLSPSTDGSVVLPPSTVSSSSPLTKVTSSLSEASAMASLGDTSSTHTSSGSSTTSSTITSSEMTSPESLIVSSSPRTLSCSAPSTAISLPVTSLSMTPSKLLTTTSSVMPSSAMMSSALSFVTSTILNMTSSTPSTNTSPTVNMITSFAKPIMTSSFSTPPDLTVKLPQTPLTVAVPILSPPCTTCSISNQSSSDGSVTSTLSRTPVSSPAIARTSDDISGHDNAANMEFCFDPHMFNGSTTTLTTTDPRSSPCKSSSGKNGYTNHHHNILAHGLLIVPNGYHLSSSSDTSLPYDYDYHTADAKQPEEFYHDASTSNGAKTNDKNCNYIIQNGGRHDQAVDFNSNNSHEYKHTRYLNQKSNGFSKPFCYNCGECGHHGSQCSETELEESIVS